MDFKEKAIKDAGDFFSAGDPSLHLMKLMMWFSKSEENLMHLSHESDQKFKSTIPIINDIVISDFKRYFNTIPKTSDEYRRFLVRRSEIFEKDKRFNLHLTVADFDLFMDALDLEYKKYIGNGKIEKPDFSMNNPQKKKEGCYIATMVYGDYNHPNVLELRDFRDNKLNKSKFGQKFIAFYYKFSPVLVMKFKNKTAINKILKRILDKIVKKLKSNKT